jgi:mRNA interferase MazF
MKVSTMTIRPGEFWVADIPFTDASGSKKRPVLVLRLDGHDLVAAAVTTAEPRSMLDIALSDWQTSGVRRASIVRLSRLDCLEQSLMVGKIGVISVADGARAKEAWALHVRPQF